MVFASSRFPPHSLARSLLASRQTSSTLLFLPRKFEFPFRRPSLPHPAQSLSMIMRTRPVEVARRKRHSNFWGRWSSFLRRRQKRLSTDRPPCLLFFSFFLSFFSTSLSLSLSLSPSLPSLLLPRPLQYNRLQHLPGTVLLRRAHRLCSGLWRRRRRRQPPRRGRVRHLLARRRLRAQQAKRV